MAAGKKLSPQARRELEDIRARLNQYLDPDGSIRALLRAVIAEDITEEQIARIHALTTEELAVLRFIATGEREPAPASGN